MPTMKDVASLAGVTPTTVSRVLNNRGYVSAETRKKVFEAMESINYQPNEIARSLLRKRTNMIGVIIPTVISGYFGALLEAIEKYCSQIDYKVIVCTSNNDQKKEKAFAQMFVANKVDGIILCSRTKDISLFKELRIPVVAIERNNDDEIPVVTCDNWNGGILAANHLIECGCKKLMYIGGYQALNLVGNLRLEAFRKVCAQAGVESIIVANDSEGRVDILAAIQQNPDVDGIFASGDIIAARAIQICIGLGLRIPEDVKVVGFDATMITQLTTPRITTVAQPIKQLGECSVQLLLQLIEGETVPNQTVFPVELLICGSTVIAPGESLNRSESEN